MRAGSFTSVPPGHRYETILYLGEAGVNAAYEGWGRALLEYHGKPRTSYQASLATSHLGYSTTAYYFYHTEGATCQPSNDQSRIAGGKKNEGPCSKIKPGKNPQVNRILAKAEVRVCWWGQARTGRIR